MEYFQLTRHILAPEHCKCFFLKHHPSNHLDHPSTLHQMPHCVMFSMYVAQKT